MADKLYHYTLWLRDGKVLDAVSNETFDIKFWELRNDRFVSFNGMAIESELVTFIRDVTPFQVEVFDVEESDPETAHKTGFTRNATTRHMRSEEQILKDNAGVVHTLKQQEKPLPLREIIDLMNYQGFDHWNTSNASGFIKHAIEKYGAKIKRTGYGIYGYDWEEDGQ